MKRICAGISLVHRVDCRIDYRRTLPPVMSEDSLLDRTVEAVRQQGGDIIEVEGGFGAEDFAFFSERVPSSHIRISSGQPGRRTASTTRIINPTKPASPKAYVPCPE